MTRDQYNELQFALWHNTRTVTNAELLEAIGFLETEKMMLQYKILGPPCGSTIIGREVITPPGAALKVTRIDLSDEAKKALTVNQAL